MDFEEFKRHVRKFLADAEIREPIKAYKSDGRYISDHGDVRIIGNSTSRCLTIRWGRSGRSYKHQAMKRVQAI